jgi:Pentatricopeptide repeat domain
MILQRVMAAMHGYAQARTTRSATHAQELLDCYIDEVMAQQAFSLAVANCSSTSPVALDTVPTLNITVFNAALHAQALVGRIDNAQHIFRQLQRLRETAFPNLQPDIVTYTTLAQAWVQSRRPETAEQVGAILTHVEQHLSLTPNTHLYNVVLSAWSLSLEQTHDDNLVTLAESLVRRMRQSGVACRAPDLYTYQTLMTLYSKSRRPDAPAKTETVLQWLLQHSSAPAALSDATLDARLQPNTHCYTAVMRAYAYSATTSHKAAHAWRLLSELQSRYETQGIRTCRPNVVAYTGVLNACGGQQAPRERNEAYAVAQRAWQALLDHPEYGRPNYLTYAAYMQALISTLPRHDARRDEGTRSIFAHCCEAGQVGGIVWNKLRFAASSDLWHEICSKAASEGSGPEFDHRYESLPVSWRINVQGERRPSRSKKSVMSDPCYR